MEWLKLIPKDPGYEADFFVADEVITGLVRADFWMVESAGRMVLVESLVEEFLWPKKVGDELPRSIAFLRGHNPELAKTIEYYEA